MRYRRLGLAVIFLVVASLSCGPITDLIGGGDDGKPDDGGGDVVPTQAPPPPATGVAPTSPPPPPPPTQEQQPPPGGSATLILNNNTGETICYVLFSPTTDDYWGDDRLGDTETIAPGESRSWSISPDTYDMQALDCSQDEIETQWEVNITTSYTWNVTGAGAPPPSGAGLDYTLSPNYGSVNLSAGFPGDPHTVDMVSGGSVDVWGESLGPGCTGYATSAPDYRVNWSGSSSRLRIFFVGDGGDDTTLIVNDAAGNWRCDDDYFAFHPMVELTNPAAGQIDIWVGSYGDGDYVGGTLYITELSYDPGNLPGGSQPPPSGGSATLYMNNNSSSTICYVRISPTSDSTWGDDQLGGTETVSPGGSRSWSISPGDYDLRAEDCSNNEIDVEWNVSISGSYTWNVTGGGAPPPSSGGLDYTQSPNYGSASLSAGFWPDPHEVSMTSGGSVDVWSLSLGSGCTGYATSAPDYRIQLSGSSSRIRIFFVPSGSDDTTLIVNTASGQWRCNDDYSGLDPMVELFNPSAGQYDIWVGSYSSGDYVAGTLYITELDYDPSDY